MNIIKHSDSYKWSHYLQYPEGTKYVSSYIEARKTNPKEIRTDKVVFFGLQAFIKKYLMDGTFLPRDIELAKKVAGLHGVPFNEAGWRHIFAEHEGRLPLLIESIPEGSVVDIGTPLVQVRNTDPQVPWLTSYLETAMLRAIWYPTTVATLSYSIKKMMKRYWDESVDEANKGVLDFALHDFGDRGVSSAESAGLGGMAHLLSFNGSDTIEALYDADRWYPEFHFDAKNRTEGPFITDYIAGYSIPAAEHATITSWGQTRESDAYSNMIDQFGGEGKIYAVVIDSYDTMNAVDNIIGDFLHDKILDKGGRIVVRPDSGDPVDLVPRIIASLGNHFGYTTNSLGYKVLHPSVRVIQGDGINYFSIDDILYAVTAKGWSAENVVFGMGGALLQKVNRDTLSFAMKCNAISFDNVDEWEPVSKNPSTDKSKASKAGRITSGLDAVYDSGIVYARHSFSSLQKKVRSSLT
jgi:nicotinamide phosphoribosyltransferase